MGDFNDSSILFLVFNVNIILLARAYIQSDIFLCMYKPTYQCTYVSRCVLAFVHVRTLAFASSTAAAAATV